MSTLDRDDVIAGLRELVFELQQSGGAAEVRLVGGAALSLRYFDRRATHDLDLVHVNPDVDGRVAAAAERVAARRGWSLDWLNFAVNRTGGVPAYGRDAEWVAIHDRAGIVIQVASKETLLAMKLRANRPGRDTRDIRLLLALCGLATIAEVESFYESFYPGDGLTDRAVRIVETILAGGASAPPTPPPQLAL